MKYLLAIVLVGLSASAAAEIEKKAQPCEKGICLYWWPKLPPLANWHHEDGSSFRYDANALAPDGTTFADAPSVMYAKALYKPRAPQIKSVASLIADDKSQFISDVPGVLISEEKPLSTADGRKLRSFSYFPAQGGNWERVSYGEEGDYYLIFTLSSRTREAYDQALPSYEALIAAYHEKP